MKRFLLAILLAALVSPSYGQQQANVYSQSVFRGVNAVKPNEAKMNETEHIVVKNFPGWGAEYDRVNGSVQDMFGEAISLEGITLADKAQYCMANKMKELGINADEWQPIGKEIKTAKADFINYRQTIDGHNVVFSRMGFRFTPDGLLLRVQMKYYGQPDVSLTPQVSTSNALNTATQDLTLTIQSQSTDKDWEWFPVPTANGYVLHPAWHFTVHATATGQPLKLTGYVDAITGALLYRENEIKESYDLTVKGSVYKTDLSSPLTNEPLANLEISIDTTNYYTDSAGYYANPGISTPAVTVVNLQGRWSKVVDDPTGISPTVTDTVSATGTSFLYPTTGTAQSQHINAYYHVNRVHDTMKHYFPTFTGMDVQLPTNVDLTSGTCNAYYNGSSINFYAAGSGCVSFAKIGTIVYHEYGHGISDKYYNMVVGTTINNSALNEGNSDVWAMCVSHDSIVGVGAYSSGGGYIRRYDIDPKVYPRDIQGEPHADGEIIAGAWWDVAKNLGSVDTMTQLFTQTYNDAPDGPDGTEGEVYHQVLISALMADDNDHNLYDGTPHFLQIVSAFAKHGIYLLGDATLVHTEVDDQPAATTIPISATMHITYPAFFKNLMLYYRARGSAWDSVMMTSATGTTYTANIPAQKKGTIVDYYFGVHDTLNFADAYAPTGYDPTLDATQVTIPYQFGVGLANVKGYTFEDSSDIDGWQIGNMTGDNATGGIWVWAVPVASSVSTSTGTLICQPGFDHTTGTGKCLVTGNAPNAAMPVGTADVDNGTTSVLTPIFDLSAYNNPIIEYYRWYSNDRGQNPRNDEWKAVIRNAPGTYWQYVDATYQSDYHWRRRIFAVRDYLSTYNGIQLKFMASDLTVPSLPYSGQSIVEAGVDDFFIYDGDTTSGVNTVTPPRTKIYPNPANELIQVDLARNVTSEGTMTLYDVSGKKMLELGVQKGVSKYIISTKELVAGQYFLIINVDKTIQSQLVIVKH